MTKFWFERSVRTCRCEPVWGGYLKNSESKNHQVWVFEKIQIQRTANSRYLKNFKELPGFMKELAKTQQF
jgi:hypothetical protein